MNNNSGNSSKESLPLIKDNNKHTYKLNNLNDNYLTDSSNDYSDNNKKSNYNQNQIKSTDKNHLNFASITTSTQLDNFNTQFQISFNELYSKPHQEIKNFNEDDDLEKVFETYWTLIWFILQSTTMISLFNVSFVIITLLVMVVSRGQEYEIIESILAYSIIFQIFCISIPWSFSVYYLQEAAVLFYEREYKALGVLTKRLLFVFLSLSLFLVIIFCLALGPFFSAILSNQNAANHITTILRYMSIGVPFWYIQFGIIMYLVAIDKLLPIMICSLISILIMLIYLLIMILAYGLVNLGVGLLLIIGSLTFLITEILYLSIYKPCGEAILEFFSFKLFRNYEEMFSGMKAFITNSITNSASTFLHFASTNFIPFFALISGDIEFSSLILIMLIMMGLLVIPESLKLSNTILFRYLLGKNISTGKMHENYNHEIVVNNRIQKLPRVLLTLILINTAYVLVFCTITTLFFSFFIGISTEIEELINMCLSQRVFYCISSALSCYFPILNECVNFFESQNITLAIILFGKILLNFGLNLVLSLNHYGINSCLLSYTLAIFFTVFFESCILFNLFKNEMKNLKIKLHSIISNNTVLKSCNEMGNFSLYNDKTNNDSSEKNKNYNKNGVYNKKNKENDEINNKNVKYD